MAELELMGLHPDGEHLVLAGPDGQRHRLPVDDALRAAVRHDRPRLEQVRTTGELRPREIQSRLRAGESPGDIALEAGVPVEHVRRYEGPVLAEQDWVAQQARSMTVGREAGSPTLGDLVVDRLARRGVGPDDLDWTAVRRPGEDWELVLHFHAGDRDRVAHWRVDLSDRGLHALDDESRWLSETDLGARDGRRHLSSVRDRDDDARSRVYDIELDALTAGVTAVEVGDESPSPDPVEPTAAASSGLDSSTAEILEGLRASRGVRQGFAPADEDEDGDHGAMTAAWDDPPAAHPSTGLRRLDTSALPLRAVPPTPVGAGRREAPAMGDDTPASGDDTPAMGDDAAPRLDETQSPRKAEPTLRRARPASRPAPRERRRQGEAAPPASGAAATSEPREPREPPEPPEPPEPASVVEAPGSPRRPKGRSRRTSVPSWDEIVFGAKPE